MDRQEALCPRLASALAGTVVKPLAAARAVHTVRAAHAAALTQMRLRCSASGHCASSSTVRSTNMCAMQRPLCAVCSRSALLEWNGKVPSSGPCGRAEEQRVKPGAESKEEQRVKSSAAWPSPARPSSARVGAPRCASSGPGA